MRVFLQHGWFAPTAVEKIGNREISGRFYDKGEHDLPASLKPFLPKSAKLLDKPTEPVPAKPVALKDFDQERASSDAYSEIVNTKKGK